MLTTSRTLTISMHINIIVATQKTVITMIIYWMKKEGETLCTFSEFRTVSI